MTFDHFIIISLFVACSHEEKQRLAYALGRGEREIIMKDIIEVGSVYKNTDLLKSLKLDIFFKKRKQSSYVLLRWNKRQNRVRKFNCKVCGHGKKIYSLNNPALVAPVSFI